VGEGRRRGARESKKGGRGNVGGRGCGAVCSKVERRTDGAEGGLGGEGGREVLAVTSISAVKGTRRRGKEITV